jgi:hypothetical protein
MNEFTKLYQLLSMLKRREHQEKPSVNESSAPNTNKTRQQALAAMTLTTTPTTLAT